MVVVRGNVVVTSVESVRIAVVGCGGGGGALLLLPPPQAESIARLRATINKMDSDVFFIYLILLEFTFPSCC
jgi:hypothetical protein